jgi:hypothetical protein
MHGYGVVWSYCTKRECCCPDIGIARIPYRLENQDLRSGARLPVSEHPSELKMDRASGVLHNQVSSWIW